jgi:hypothetical protein
LLLRVLCSDKFVWHLLLLAAQAGYEKASEMIRAGWTSIVADKWTDFASVVEKLVPIDIPYPGPFLFRGMADQASPLKPSLSAYLEGKTYATALDIELELLKEFRTQVDALEKSSVQFNTCAQISGLLTSGDYSSKFDYLGWWSYMHHYQAPTRLIAWTYSPYVALYHAVERGWGAPGKDAAIYCFNVHVFIEAFRTKYGSAVDPARPETQPTFFRGANPGDRLIALRPNWMTDRMVAQQTCFTVCQNPSLDHLPILDDLLRDKVVPTAPSRSTVYHLNPGGHPGGQT